MFSNEEVGSFLCGLEGFLGLILGGSFLTEGLRQGRYYVCWNKRKQVFLVRQLFWWGCKDPSSIHFAFFSMGCSELLWGLSLFQHPERRLHVGGLGPVLVTACHLVLLTFPLAGIQVHGHTQEQERLGNECSSVPRRDMGLVIS